MKKLLVVPLMAALLFLGGQGCAHAYAIYDWVKLGSNLEDNGYYPRVEWRVTDEEYNNRLLTSVTPGDSVYGCLVTSEEPHFYPYLFTYNWPNANETLFVAFLSPDRKTITNIVCNYDVGGSSNSIGIIDDTCDTALYFSANRLWGNTEFPTWMEWDEYGAWVLRENTASTVPEPGSFLLVAIGLSSLILGSRILKVSC